jgi:NitT/TauT family transport system permease protein
VALGLGLAPRVVVVVLFSWVFIAANVRAGARRVDKQLVEMARSYGASERQVWQRILIPGAIPAMFVALRIGLGRAFAGMVIVELIMLPVGVGALLLDYRGDFKAGLLYATTIVLMLEAVVLALVMQKIEARLNQWM